MKNSKIILTLSGMALAVSMAASPDAMAEKQPHMNKALHHLKKAEVQLEKASHDKFGHRVKALKLVRQAIAEVKKGRRADTLNPFH